MNLFLSSLLHGDEGSQSGAFPNQRKESYNAIFSIFHSIKNSEDIVDGLKSNVSDLLSHLLPWLSHVVKQFRTTNSIELPLSPVTSFYLFTFTMFYVL